MAHQNIRGTKSRALAKSLSGLILLGTPHINALTRTTELFPCESTCLLTGSLSEIDFFSWKFKQIASFDILSVNQELDADSGSESDSDTEMIDAGNYSTIVDKHVVTIGSQAEYLLGVRLPVAKLCSLPLVADDTVSA